MSGEDTTSKNFVCVKTTENTNYCQPEICTLNQAQLKASNDATLTVYELVDVGHIEELHEHIKFWQVMQQECVNKLEKLFALQQSKPPMPTSPLRSLFGTWGYDDVRRWFVDGAKWWEWHSAGATMWQSDQRLAEAEAERLFAGKPENSDDTDKWQFVGRVEAFDVSPVRWALLGAHIDCRIRGCGAWLDVLVNQPNLDIAKDLVVRAIGVSNSTPGIEIKAMAECCRLGACLDWLPAGEEICPTCGSHKTPKTTGEPAWRHP